MKAYLAIAVVAGSLVLGGCATTTPQASTAAAAATSAEALPKEDPQYYTGSRIPNKPARDRMVKQIEGGSYTREQMNSTMSQPDPQ
jgi:hypothetical protein